MTENKNTKKYTYEELKLKAKYRFCDSRLKMIDCEIKYNRELSDCPVGSPCSEGGWIVIFNGWMRKIEASE